MPMHEAMDIETVAGLLGVSERQVRTYIAQCGLPAGREGRTRTFVWPDVLQWYVGYRSGVDVGAAPAADDDFDPDATVPRPGKPENLQQASLRKTRAEADLKQLQLSRLRGEVISITDARERLGRMLGNLRTKLLGLPPKLANRLEGLKTRTEREATITEEMTTLCRELSTGEIVGLPEEAAAETSAAGPSDTVDALSASAEDPPPEFEFAWATVDQS